MQSEDNFIKSVTSFDNSGYMVDYCPYCNDDISYKNNPGRINHDFIKETGYFDRICVYKCNKFNKYYYVIG